MNKIGRIGEKIAVKYLKKHGYKIIERNFKLKCGEIDIVAKEGEYICFIEVKTRTSNSFAEPYEAVDYKKQKKLYRLAEIWLSMHKLHNALCRFDIVSILLNKNCAICEIKLIKDAFWLDNV